MALVYIVEDDANILEIETVALQNAGMEVAGFEEAASLFAALRERTPQLVILDIMLPGEDGMQVLGKLRADPMTRRLPVMMVTAKNAEIEVVRGLDLGADDYMTKPFGIMELISRVRALLRRSEPAAGGETLQAGGLRIETESRQCYVEGQPVTLTYKEYELLECLMRNAGIVMKRETLLERIWGYDYEGGTRTLDAHIKTLRRKLGPGGQCIETVRNVGYMIR